MLRENLSARHDPIKKLWELSEASSEKIAIEKLMFPTEEPKKEASWLLE